MTGNPPVRKPQDVRPGRLPAPDIAANFSDMHPPLSRAQALVEADRCYFCFDAPCTTACPTGIDVPGFIQKIRSDNIKGSAHTILSANIMGGMCARVCPTEVLCEEACVRNLHEDRPVNIGLLQRYATDPILEANVALFERAPDSGKRVAVIGGGPAGLSCAHRLAMLGHAVTIFNRDRLAGGLNEYGIAAYKTVDDFAQREIDYILGIGGIEVQNGKSLGIDFTLGELRGKYDAVFLGAGLAGVNELDVENQNAVGVLNAVDYIAELRQAKDKNRLPVGRRIVVIGGGMTAIDIAVQSKLLGAEVVDIVYRRGPEHMGASRYEQEFAQAKGVTIRHWSMPKRILVDREGRVTGIECERSTADKHGNGEGNGELWSVDVDIVFKAVGQRLSLDLNGSGNDIPEQQSGKLVIDENSKTSLPDVWAGGDCVLDGDDLTVTAVQQGKLAAIAIDRSLRGSR